MHSGNGTSAFLPGDVDPVMGDGERAAERPLIGELHRRHRATEFRKFLTSIDKAVPAELAVHVMRQPVLYCSTRIGSNPGSHWASAGRQSSPIQRFSYVFGSLAEARASSTRGLVTSRSAQTR